MTRHAWLSRRGGFVLVTAIFVSVVLTILTVSLGARSLGEVHVARQYDWQDRAFQNAEASIDESMRRIRGKVYDSWSSTPFGDGTYWAEVDTVIAKQLYRVTSHGQVQSQQLNLETYVHTVPSSIWQFPIVADEGIRISGDVTTDSYNSADGPYDPATAGDGGDIATNSIDDDAIRINGSVDINGQIQVGTDSTDPDEGVRISGGSYTVSADPPIGTMTEPLVMDSVVVPGGLPCPDRTMSNVADSIVLPAGEYCYDDLSISGGAVLSVSGPVTIYIRGIFSMSGGGVAGDPASPPNLELLFASGSDDPSLSGGATLYGGIYAPDGTIKLAGNTTVYGALVADRIRMSGSDNTVHYDVAMAGGGNNLGNPVPSVVAWREL